MILDYQGEASLEDLLASPTGSSALTRLQFGGYCWGRGIFHA